MTKIAIVTGASSGIGKACALGLLKDGWKVALIGRRADALQATVDAAGEHKPMPLLFRPMCPKKKTLPKCLLR